MLTILVARAARSLAESCSSLDLVRAVVVFFALECEAAREVVREVVWEVVDEDSVSGSSNSLSVTTVAVVHVAVDARAALAASAFA